MRAINIIWDVDFEDELELLPTEIEIPEDIYFEDDVSDYISYVTGYCHTGFDIVD